MDIVLSTLNIAFKMLWVAAAASLVTASGAVGGPVTPDSFVIKMRGR
jgi:hypothetical protein